MGQGEGAGFKAIYAHGLRGEVGEALQLLDALEPSDLTEEERATALRYRDRFSGASDLLDDLEEDDPFVRTLVLAFRAYWRDAMLGRVERSAAEAQLRSRLRGLLASGGGPGAEDFASAEPLLREALEQRGYGSLFGVTRPFRELMLWSDEARQTYAVDLPEREAPFPVTVVMLDGFLSLGWAHFATLGKFHTGGWAASEALYCVRQSYDLASERFRFSYLVHEGQHFSDNRTFPKLDQAELEYRAKLAELCVARDSLGTILEHFTGSMKRDRRNPHAFAEYWVVTNLRAELFGEGDVADPCEWTLLDPEQINAAALVILKRCTQALSAVGAEAVVRILPD